MPQIKKAKFPVLRWAVLSVVLTVFCVACGYTIRGSGRFLSDKNIRSMYIPLFKNSTTRFEIDLKLTEAVINEFVSRGKVAIVQSPETADGVLEGNILTFTVLPIAYTDAQGSADRYSITIRASVILRDSKTNAVLFTNSDYTYSGEYEVPEGMDYESQETEALGDIAEQFAKNLIIFIIEGF